MPTQGSGGAAQRWSQPLTQDLGQVLYLTLPVSVTGPGKGLVSVTRAGQSEPTLQS